ncbi:MAG: peptidoglycan editing factor PgeF [Clostridiaceae bacterium]
MTNIYIDSNEFITEDFCTAAAVFSTAKNNVNFYRKSAEGIKNLESIKNWFSVDAVAYLSQIHSDIVCIYDGTSQTGDAIITDKPGIAIGVFTADCVPVLIYDPVNKAAAAVHSGWKGTFSRIVEKTIVKMGEEYGSEPSSLKVVIGPHIRDCCYEVGNEVIAKFMNDEFYSEADIFSGIHLSMEKCILWQLKNCGVPEENVKSEKQCTLCSVNVLHSYRRGDIAKRQFSFIYIK